MNMQGYLQEEANAERAWAAYANACRDLATAGSNERILFKSIVAYQYARWRTIQAGIRKNYSAERITYRRQQTNAA